MLKSMAQVVYRSFPTGLKDALRPLIPAIQYLVDPLYRRHRAWLRTTYLPFAYGQRAEILLSIARFCNANRPIEGYYFEFGSHTGNTLRMAWRHTGTLFDWTYVSFDSFEGLPDIREMDRQEIWQKGKLKTAEDDLKRVMYAAGMPKDRLITVKGFYENTLTDELVRTLSGKKAAAIYIDCDLYSSTVPILEFIRHFLQVGTVIVFDDWYCFHGDPRRGEQRAWGEFLARYPSLRFTEFVRTCEANSFIYLGDDKDMKRIDSLYQTETSVSR